MAGRVHRALRCGGTSSRHLKIFRAAVAAQSIGDPGTISAPNDAEVLVATGRGALRLDEVQLEGKRRMSAAEFLARFFLPKSAFLIDHPAEMESATPAYKRIVLKLSGEALRETGGRDTISPQIVKEIARQVKEVDDLGVQISIVVGGGNIWRGLAASHRGMDRTTADYMGMLATVINGLALQSQLEQTGVTTRVQTAIEMQNVAEPFILRRAVRHLERGRVVIFVAGTGNPIFRPTRPPRCARARSAPTSS